MQSGIYFKYPVDANIVFSIHHRFVRTYILVANGSVVTFGATVFYCFRLCHQHARPKGVEGVVSSEFYIMIGIRCVVKIYLCRIIHDARFVSDTCGFFRVSCRRSGT